MSERSDKRHASHPEAWGWANTDDCSVDGKMHVRILIDEIERLRNLNTDYWHKIREDLLAARARLEKLEARITKADQPPGWSMLDKESP